jgi:hypothetical protein
MMMKDTKSSVVKRQLDGEQRHIRDIACKHREKPSGKPKRKENGTRSNTMGIDNEKGTKATQDEES